MLKESIKYYAQKFRRKRSVIISIRVSFNVTINGKPDDSANPSENLQNSIGSIAYYDISSCSFGMGLDDIQVSAILKDQHKSIVYPTFARSFFNYRIFRTPAQAIAISSIVLDPNSG